MLDPVTLPCGTIVDRVTIERSLLDSEINPFSREPMTVGDLVPNTELKGQIQEWIASRRKGSAHGDTEVAVDGEQ
jgi:ubiquitin conjugation factor E4 B